jgi:hypothetical protein
MTNKKSIHIFEPRPSWNSARPELWSEAERRRRKGSGWSFTKAGSAKWRGRWNKRKLLKKFEDEFNCGKLTRSVGRLIASRKLTAKLPILALARWDYDSKWNFFCLCRNAQGAKAAQLLTVSQAFSSAVLYQCKYSLRKLF